MLLFLVGNVGKATFSIVIPAHNAEAHIARCIAAARRAFGESADCILIDDASTDHTVAIARAASVKVMSLPGNGGAGAARNAGARLAKGDILVFIDADCAPHPDICEKLRAVFRDPNVDAVVGAYDDKPAAPGAVSHFRNLLHTYTHRSAGSVGVTFWTGCGAVRRDVFLSLGGFDQSWRYMEDVEFGQRLAYSGGRIRFDASIRVCHLKRWTLGSMVQTDVFRRAAPWTRLLLSRRWFPNVLNLSHSQRASVSLAVVAVVSGVLAVGIPALLLLTLACLTAIALLNRSFYGFVRRTDSRAVTLAAGPLHIVYFLSAAAGLAVGCAAFAKDWIAGRRTVASTIPISVRAAVPETAPEPSAPKVLKAVTGR